MSHTPGPWYDDGYRIHAPVTNPTQDKREGRVIVDYKYSEDFNPMDGPLLAAAPDLLETLEEINKEIVLSQTSWKLARNVRALIERARGRA